MGYPSYRVERVFWPAVPHKKRPAALWLLAVFYILSPSFGGERVHSERVPPPLLFALCYALPAR